MKLREAAVDGNGDRHKPDEDNLTKTMALSLCESLTTATEPHDLSHGGGVTAKALWHKDNYRQIHGSSSSNFPRRHGPMLRI